MQQIQFQSKAAIALFLSCMLCVLFAQIKTPFLYYDEGFAVFNAARIMDGDAPYKDFWTIYPPGQFYILAVIFKTFGTTLLVARIYDTIVRFVIVISAYLIAKKITSHNLALLACTVTTFLLGFADSYTYAVFPAMALALLSILCLVQYILTNKQRWVLLSGVLIGMVTLFRWDIGLYTGISVTLTIILSHYFCRTQNIKPSTNSLFTTSELLSRLLGAALIIVIPCYGYIIYNSGFENLWAQVVIFPITKLHDVRWLSYPTLIPSNVPFSLSIFAFIATNSEFSNWLRFYSLIVVYVIAVSNFTFSILRKHIVFSRQQYFATTTLTILGILLFALALSRYDYIHVLPASIIAFLVIIPLVRRAVSNINSLVFKYYFLTAVIVLISLSFLFPLRNLVTSIKNFSPLGCYSRIDRAGCIYLSKDQEQTIDFIRTHTRDGELIFVGNRRHDIISINDVGFYFLSKHPSATKYHELHPGVATTRSVQEAIVQDIKSNSVNWIVLVNVPNSEEPNASAVSSGVHFLDDFIRSTYASMITYGNYEIWKKTIK